MDGLREWTPRALHGRTGLTSADLAILTLAAAPAEGTHISIRHVTQQLDYEHARHALTAVAHAAGYHQPTRTIDNTGHMPRIVQQAPLITWDVEPEAPTTTPPARATAKRKIRSSTSLVMATSCRFCS